jgi:hypothetical protein
MMNIFLGSMRNKLITIRSYNRVKNVKSLRSRQDFVRFVLNPPLSLSGQEKPIAKASRLWRLERIAREARSIDNGSFLLKDPRLERFKAILHVGWGMDAAAETGFDFPRFSRIVADTADPNYRLLVFEGAGVIGLAASQPRRSALIGLPVPRTFSRDVLARFIRSIDRQALDMMSHGFGRGLYFKTLTLRSSLKRARSCLPFFHPGSAVKGVGFAFAMVNCQSLPGVFMTADRLKESKDRMEGIECFTDGVVTALSFLEWNFPGLLGTLGSHDITQAAWAKLRSYQEAGGVFLF